eukprot:Pompholyxophrys_punicea_v1_NODE_127_length_3306_cov_27.855737.p5 type:complete len:101 gc:universal NODE_127_length_3306_cov_27.855737:502-200(-)
MATTQEEPVSISLQSPLPNQSTDTDPSKCHVQNCGILYQLSLPTSWPRYPFEKRSKANCLALCPNGEFEFTSGCTTNSTKFMTKFISYHQQLWSPALARH